MPPTPTLLPPGVPLVHLPSSYSLWASAPHAIQMWNQAGDIRTVVQLVILAAILFIFVFVLIRFRRDFTRRDEQR